jgi:hypothetical protein
MMIIWWSKHVGVILNVLVCGIWINVLIKTSALVGPLYIVNWNARWNSEICGKHIWEMYLFHWRGTCMCCLMYRQMCVFIGGIGNWSKSEQGPEGCITWRAGTRTCQGALWLLEVSSSAAGSSCSEGCAGVRTPCPRPRTFTWSYVLNPRKCHFTSDACYVTARWWS